MKFWTTILLLFFSAVSFQSQAGMNKWSRLTEPKGGRLWTLRSIPLSWGTIYLVGTGENGVFKSVDGGNTWDQACGGKPKSYIYAIEYEETPTETTILFASYGDGVFKSKDFGETCKEINSGLPTGKSTWALAVAPNGNWYVGLFDEGVYVSQDKGESWIAINAGLTNKKVTSKLAIDSEGNLYIGSYGGGMFKRPAGAQEWQALNEGLPDLNLIGVFVDTNEGVSKIYAAPLKSGLYKLENGVWIPDNEGLPQDTVMGYERDASGTVYLGTHRNGIFSRAAGETTWKPLPINSLLPSNFVRGITFGPEGELLVGMNGFGVWRCAIGCEQIFYRTDVVPTDILVDSSGMLFLATYAGLHKSATGSQWSSGGRELGGRYMIQITQVGQTLFASASQELFRSDDDAQTWQKSDKGLEGKYQFRVHSCRLGTQDLLFATTYYGIFKSDDGGVNWREVSEGLTDKNTWSMGCIPAQPLAEGEPSNTGIVVAGNEAGGHVSYSIDFGETWQEVTNELSSTRPWAFACNPSGSACYADTLDGVVYKTMDGGTSWQQCAPMEVSVLHRDMIVDGEEIFVGGDGGYVFHSTDSCQSWQRLGVVLPTDMAWSLAMKKEGDDRTLCAGTAGEGNYCYSFQICGNEKKEFKEGCDDGNQEAGDGCTELCQIEDGDGDGIADHQDNCPQFFCLDQTDSDQDGQGDVCDDDDDGDGLLDSADNCISVVNEDQLDIDGDGSGDLCDDDRDGDEALDETDNCKLVQNKDQLDTDNDGLGDVCDDDKDGDNYLDLEDNCPLMVNADQLDSDQDKLGDLCDETPQPVVDEGGDELALLEGEAGEKALPTPLDPETGLPLPGHFKEPSSETAQGEDTSGGDNGGASGGGGVSGCQLILKKR